MKQLALVTLMSFSFLSSASVIEKITFADTQSVSGKNLTLNGVGLRKATKFGITVKVYVAALYLKAKSQDATGILSSKDNKRLELVFLRNLDKATITEGWESGHFKNCTVDCDKSKEGLREFNKGMADVREGSRVVIDVTADAVDVEIQAKENKTTHIANPAFAKNVLGIFIGGTPPTEDLKNGLLGVSPAK